MFAYIANRWMMRYAALIVVTCIFLCLTFNYTFPLHRPGGKWRLESYHNMSKPRVMSNNQKILLRFKRLVNQMERSTKTKTDLYQNPPQETSVNSANKDFTEEDLRQYEQLVLVKKYPYLDLKEIDLRLSPSDKQTRQSVKFNVDRSPQKFVGDLNMWENVINEDPSPNVEIINRGLSGFAIPAKIIANNTNLKFTELNKNIPHTIPTQVVIKPNMILSSLHEDIVNLL